MKIVDAALVRDQNENDVDDSCFDSSEMVHMIQKFEDPRLVELREQINLLQFIDSNGVLQRHPQTKFPNDISSDQAHMYGLATGLPFYWRSLDSVFSLLRTSNGDVVSLGYFAFIKRWQWLSNLSLIFQIILFWIPVRWCDGENPTVRLGPIKLNVGYRHWCGDYRLFKQSLYYAPVFIRRLVSKRTLKKMTRLYWAPETNAEWLIAIDDRFIEECL